MSLLNRGLLMTRLLMFAAATAFAGVMLADDVVSIVDHAEHQRWKAVHNELVSAQGGAEPNAVQAVQADGMTALHWAAYHGDSETVRALLVNGADPNATTEYSVTPVSIACESGRSGIVKLLLDHGGDCKTRLPGRQTMLMLAARAGDARSIDHLIQAGADPNAAEVRGQTALMWAAAVGNTDAVVRLVDAGAEIGAKAKSGYSAFFFACRNGQLETVKRLLEFGVDVNEAMRPSNTSGRNPRDRMSGLMLAVESGHFELALTLVEHGADPNDQRSGFGPLHALTWVRRARRGDGVDGDPEPRGSGAVTSLEFVRRIVALGGDVNLQLSRGRGGKAELTGKGCTPFVMAAKTADLPYLKTLIDVGADPTLTNADHCTALLAASGIGVKSLVDEDPGSEDEVIAAVTYLLELGLDINAVDSNGETVMHGAAYRNYPAEVAFLHAAGASPSVWNRENKHGWTPREIATGQRPGAFKPSPPTIAAIDTILASD